MEEYIVWNEQYCIGVEVIDAQHIKLITIINRLENARVANTAETDAEFVEIMKESLEYVMVHFRDEEKLMKSLQYPHFFEHQKMHEQFVKQIGSTVQEYNTGKNSVKDTYASFLRDWLLNHIATHDQLIGKMYQSQMSDKG